MLQVSVQSDWPNDSIRISITTQILQNKRFVSWAHENLQISSRNYSETSIETCARKHLISSRTGSRKKKMQLFAHQSCELYSRKNVPRLPIASTRRRATNGNPVVNPRVRASELLRSNWRKQREFLIGSAASISRLSFADFDSTILSCSCIKKVVLHRRIFPQRRNVYDK